MLCIEDDPVVQLALKDIVETAGGRYIAAQSARDAEASLAETAFDLIILDRKLPDSDGLLLLQTIRENGNCPVIVLSAMSDTQDKILGIGLGAAEYITKPFNPAELSSRVRALLLASGRGDDADLSDPIECGDLYFKPDFRMLRIGSEAQYLPPAEARLLHVLLLNPGTPQSRDTLTRFACGRDWDPGDRTIDVLISRLRNKIPEETARIVTVHRLGYVLLPAIDAPQSYPDSA